MSVRRRTRARIAALSWTERSLAVGAVLGAAWSLWELPAYTLPWRLVRDLTLFVVAPGVLALAHGRHVGWRIDRRAVRNAALLAAFVLPFYLVGASLPTVRTYYPMWETTAALARFLPHALGQLLVVVAAETYYRGLLCVGVRDLGPKSAFISPVVYALHHVGKPPVELLLSGPTDVLFGLVDYDCESIFPSVVAHGLGLALLDWLVLHPPLLAPARVVRWLSWLPVRV